MARIKVEDIVDHLDSEFRRALADAIRQHIPEAQFNENQVFDTFKRRVYQHCSTWEKVPDRFVDAD